MQMTKTVTELDLYRFLGLVMKAGRLTSGEDQVLNAIRGMNACLVIVAEDASANTQKLYNDKCSFYETKIIAFGSCEGLGKCIGKKKRAALAITDAGFANSFKTKYLQYRN